MPIDEAARESAAQPSPPPLWRGPRLVLASSSAGRAALLRSAGLDFAVDPARLDERAVEEEFRRAGGAASGLAARLAEAKAIEVSARHPGALCLGADQTLTLGERVLHKPKDMAAARDHLQLLAGRVHRLISAFCFARNGRALFQAADEARMAMRPLDPGALSLYLSLAGEAALASVGAYQAEGLGVHLFERIEGDHATIIGLPLLPVLAWLRRQGYLAL
ncbi:MAG TPA: Maf family protein [Roseiarcus sp.]|nr:Maf family protein [Roseiarcus sp.]